MKQSVVEKRLFKEEKKTRHDFGREEFLKLVWQFKNAYVRAWLFALLRHDSRDCVCVWETT